jgi:hypothetical protein
MEENDKFRQRKAIHSTVQIRVYVHNLSNLRTFSEQI